MRETFHDSRGSLWIKVTNILLLILFLFLILDLFKLSKRWASFRFLMARMPCSNVYKRLILVQKSVKAMTAYFKHFWKMWTSEIFPNFHLLAALSTQGSNFLSFFKAARNTSWWTTKWLIIPQELEFSKAYFWSTNPYLKRCSAFFPPSHKLGSWYTIYTH